MSKLHINFRPKDEGNNNPSLLAQLVERYTGIAEVKDSNPVQA